jgi:hypothetical protein
MKRFLFTIAIAAAFSAACFAQMAAPAADGPVDFSVTLADLHRAAASGDDRGIPADRSLAIDGEVGSVTVRADTEDQFTAEVELIGGSWIGETKVELYRAYALFDGTRFRDLFSRRSAGRIQAGDRILILAKYLGIGVDYDETTPIAVIEGSALRRL